MWKIVKTELNYLRWLLAASYAFFLAITLLVYFKGNPDKLFGSAVFLPLYIGFVHFIVNLVLLYLEMKETRLRHLVPLPISETGIGIARLVTPFFLWLAYVLLSVICVLVLLSGFDIEPSNIADPPFELVDAGLVLVHPSQPDTANVIPPWYALLLALNVWLAITYAARLFSELYGRILLLIGAIVILFDGLVLPSIHKVLARNVDAYIWIMLERHYNWIMLCAVVFFCLLIHVSFVRRRSHLT